MGDLQRSRVESPNGELLGLSPFDCRAFKTDSRRPLRADGFRKERSRVTVDRSVKKEEEIGDAFFDLLYASTPDFGVKD